MSENMIPDRALAFLHVLLVTQTDGQAREPRS
jgi:hypothetical protein